MGTKRVGWARIKSLINENQNQLKTRNMAMYSTSLLAATTTLSASDSGKVVALDMSTGWVLTLPKAVAGLNFKLVMAANVQNDASAFIRTSAGSTDAFFGAINLVSTTENKRDTQSISIQTAVTTPASYNELSLDSNATTSGGLAGDVIELIAVSNTVWLCTGTLTTSGSPSGPTVIQGQ